MDLVARFITSFNGVLFLCGAIVAWAIVASVFYTARMQTACGEIATLGRALDAVQGEEGFASELEAIDQRVRASTLLRHAWLEFRETLIYPEPDEMPQVLYNTRGAGDFFSRTDLLGERLNLRFYNALPNLFTGAGILGTFIGLVAGIYLASKSLVDPDRAPEALSQLLGGASLAFLTSIAGLMSSILFSVGEKHLLHRFEQARQHWVNGLDARLRKVTLEHVARDSLGQNRLQTEVLTQFTEQLAFQITEAIEKKMPEAIGAQVTAPLAEALQGIRSALDEFASNQAQTNQDALRKLLEDFSNSIRGAAGEEMREFAKAVQAMGQQIKEQMAAVELQQKAVANQTERTVKNLQSSFTDGAEKLQAQVSESVDEILAGLSTTITEMAQLLDGSVGRMSGQLDKTADAFKDSVGDLTRSVEDIRGILTGTKELMEYLDQLIAAARQSHSTLDRAAKSVAASAANIEAAAESTGGFATKVDEAAETVGEAVSRLESTQQQTVRVWADYQQRFEGVDESLTGVVREIQEGLERYAATIREFIQELDGHTGKITATLAGAVEELQGSIEDLGETLEKGTE